MEPGSSPDQATSEVFAASVVRPTTKIVVLNSCSLPTSVLSQILSQLQANTELQEFTFTPGRGLEWEALPSLFQFRCPNKLKILSVRESQLHRMRDSAFRSDMETLAKMTSLDTMELDGTSLRTYGPVMAAAMSFWPKEACLTKLDLTRCYIQNEPAKAISKVISGCRNIRLLFLGHNNFHHCVALLFSAHCEYSALENISLGNNSLCGEDFVALGERILAKSFPQLHSIDFSQFADASEDHVGHLLNAVKTQPRPNWKIDVGPTNKLSSEFKEAWETELRQITRHLTL